MCFISGPKVQTVPEPAPAPPPPSPTVKELATPESRRVSANQAALRRGISALRIQRTDTSGIPNPSPIPSSGLAIG